MDCPFRWRLRGACLPAGQSGTQAAKVTPRRGSRETEQAVPDGPAARQKRARSGRTMLVGTIDVSRIPGASSGFVETDGYRPKTAPERLSAALRSLRPHCPAGRRGAVPAGGSAGAGRGCGAPGRQGRRAGAAALFDARRGRRRGAPHRGGWCARGGRARRVGGGALRRCEGLGRGGGSRGAAAGAHARSCVARGAPGGGAARRSAVRLRPAPHVAARAAPTAGTPAAISEDGARGATPICAKPWSSSAPMWRSRSTQERPPMVTPTSRTPSRWAGSRC